MQLFLFNLQKAIQRKHLSAFFKMVQPLSFETFFFFEVVVPKKGKLISSLRSFYYWRQWSENGD